MFAQLNPFVYEQVCFVEEKTIEFITKNSYIVILGLGTLLGSCLRGRLDRCWKHTKLDGTLESVTKQNLLQRIKDLNQIIVTLIQDKQNLEDHLNEKTKENTRLKQELLPKDSLLGHRGC